MISIDTSDFKAKAIALHQAAVSAYKSLGVDMPGSSHKPLADMKKDHHVDLGLIPSVLPALKEFKASLALILNTLQRADVPNTVKKELTIKADWQSFVDFHNVVNAAIQEGPDGNQSAINLVRDMNTPMIASMVLNALASDLTLEPSVESLKGSLQRWSTGYSNRAQRRMFASMLDKIANALEERGLAHLALEVDKVSNTLETTD
jgi:hypothetical protein